MHLKLEGSMANLDIMMQMGRMRNDFVVVTFPVNAITPGQLITFGKVKEAKQCFINALEQLKCWHEVHKLFQGGITFFTLALIENTGNVLFLDWSKVERLDSALIPVHNSSGRYYMPHWLRSEEQLKIADMVALLLAYADLVASFTHEPIMPSQVIREKSVNLDALEWMNWAKEANLVQGAFLNALLLKYGRLAKHSY